MNGLRLPVDFADADDWGDHDDAPFMESDVLVFVIHEGCGCHGCNLKRAQIDSHRMLFLAERARRYAMRKQEFDDTVEPSEYHRMKKARERLQQSFDEWLPVTIVWKN